MSDSPREHASRVRLAFERDIILLKMEQILPLKALRPGVKDSKKYAQILSSVKAVGLVEPPVVAPDPKASGVYFLLDGLLRVEALKDLGITEVECLVSTDDEAYTYNKRINRLAAVQEHRMIVRTLDRGVPAEHIADALGLNVSTIRHRFRMLDGICPEAIDLLKDTTCPLSVFKLMREMSPLRQLEAAELMIGQNNFSTMFAKAILAATPENQLVDPRKKKPTKGSSVSTEQIARLERELASLQTQVKSVEEVYGMDNLHLTVAKSYLAKLLANPRIVRWLRQGRPEYLSEFQSIAEIEDIGPAQSAGA